MAGHTKKKTFLYLCPYMWHSLKLTASLHLKIDGWKTIGSFRDAIHFQVRTVSFREGALPKTNSSPLKIGRPKRKLVSQPSIFKCYVSFREGAFVQRPSRRLFRKPKLRCFAIKENIQPPKTPKTQGMVLSTRVILCDLFIP